MPAGLLAVGVAIQPACRDAPREATQAPAQGGGPPPSSAGMEADGVEPVSAGPRRPAEPEGRAREPVSPEARTAYQSAMIDASAALYSGLFDDARRHYLQATDLRPEKTAPLLGALRTMMPKGHAEARAGIERQLEKKIVAYRSDPKTRGAGFLLGARLATAMQRPHEALDAARLAVQHLPNLGVAWRVLGEAALMAEQWTRAVEAFRRAADLGLSARSGTWERMADALDELGDLGEAESAARKALMFTGRDAHAKRRRLNLLATILKHRGNLEEAWSVSEMALELGSEDPAVLHNRATLEEARGHPEEALELYRMALARTAIPMTSWRLGRLLLKLDRRQEGLEALTDASAHLDKWTWPRSTRWWPAYDVGRVYARSGYDKQAVGWFEDAMREARTSQSLRKVRSWLAYARVQAGLRHEDARPETTD